MIKFENECIDCVSSGLSCIGEGCPNRRVARFYCDSCKQEATIYHFDTRELCIDCIEKELCEVTEYE